SRRAAGGGKNGGGVGGGETAAARRGGRRGRGSPEISVRRVALSFVLDSFPPTPPRAPAPNRRPAPPPPARAPRAPPRPPRRRRRPRHPVALAGVPVPLAVRLPHPGRGLPPVAARPGADLRQAPRRPVVAAQPGGRRGPGHRLRAPGVPRPLRHAPGPAR